MKKIIDKTLQASHCLTELLKKKWHEADQRYRMQEQQRQQEQRNIAAYEHMMGIAQDLFAVFNGRAYPDLVAIRHPEDIRIVNYKLHQNRFYFMFSLSKSTSEKLYQSDLDNLCRLMNDDIFRFRSEFLYYPESTVMYPYLAAGIQVLAIKEYRYHIHILVA